MDYSGIGSRLNNAPLSYLQKHPILLSSHTLTDLITRHQHLNNFHMGPQLLLATLRETYLRNAFYVFECGHSPIQRMGDCGSSHSD